MSTLSDYLKIIQEEATQETKILEKLNTIRNKLNSVANINKEQYQKLDSSMNSYWKQINKSNINTETKKTCASLIQTIKSMAKSKTK